MVIVLWILAGWAVLAVLAAVLFAAVGRSALREDEALGYTGVEPLAGPQDDARDQASASAAATV